MVFDPATIDADGFEFRQPLLDTMVFQCFTMEANHWSNDGMVTIHRYGLLHVLIGNVPLTSNSGSDEFAKDMNLALLFF